MLSSAHSFLHTHIRMEKGGVERNGWENLKKGKTEKRKGESERTENVNEDKYMQGKQTYRREK